MSVPLRQLTDKYKPDLHISKLICIAPETVCRKGMQLGWSWQDLCTGKKKRERTKSESVEHPGEWQLWHEHPLEDSSQRGFSSHGGGTELLTPLPMPKSAETRCSQPRALECCWQPWWEAAVSTWAATSGAQAAIQPKLHEPGCASSSADPLPFAEFNFCSSWMTHVGMRVQKIQLSVHQLCSCSKQEGCHSRTMCKLSSHRNKWTCRSGSWDVPLTFA